MKRDGNLNFKFYCYFSELHELLSESKHAYLEGE